MLIAENLLNSLIEQMKVTDTFGSLLFQYNRKQNCFQLKSKWKQVVYKTRLFAGGIIALLVLGQLFWTWKKVNVFVQLHSMFFFCAMLLHLYTHCVFFSKADLIVAYLNGMLAFERNRNAQNWNTNGSLLTKIVMKIMQVSCVTVPLFYHVDVFRNPCLPVNLGGYWIVTSQCGDHIGTDSQATWSTQEILNKIVVFLVNYCNWSFLLSGSYFQMTLVLMLKSYCLKMYILLAGKTISESNRGIRKTNWRTCLIYREIEVMALEYRRLYSCYMTSDVLVSVMVVQTISLYACFNFGFKLPLSMLLVFTCTAVNAGVVLVCMFTSLANVYKSSNYVLKVQLKKGTTKPFAWFRRFQKSCKTVKAYIGSTNFVEPLTPLEIEQFSIDQTISLMLLEI